MIRRLGSLALGTVHELGEISLFGLSSLAGFGSQRHRMAKLVTAIHEIGVRCTPIVATVGLFTGLVMGLQLYYTLVQFGAESALGTAVALSLIRELGPVLTALMIVGQAGSAMASELGIQRNDEQIDALQTMSIDPKGYLVGPRLVAALICYPILTAIFDLIGILGGYLTGSVLLSVDPGVYWARVFESVTWADVRGGFVKAIVFGLLTIAICAYRGFNTHRKASFPGVRGVSESATRAVVWSSVSVLAADYLITSFLL
ncbi:ABC transporter permease [Coraliomargarita sinensis]|uniref:ABC transporter permease n=1 Tax=Coraliomargarita sinensis TaxID=2174842 RepID=A0A317ZEX1_9BACT|nr:ABC transporter permease [Coraliomargarita sinensis]PXA02897.1 ABC transporter permease [Coraliomargarita sinensis]